MTGRILIASAATTDAGRIRNIGDEALTEGLVDVFQERGVTAIASLNGQWSIPRPGRVNLSKFSELIGAIGRSDMIVIGGGTLLADNLTGCRRLNGLPRYVFAVASVAKLMRKRYVVLGVGAENWPVGAKDLALRRTVLGAAHVSTRDSKSAELIEAATGRRPDISGDTFFGANLRNLDGCHSRKLGHCVLALSGRSDERSIKAAVEVVGESGCESVRIRRMDQSGEDAVVAQRAYDLLYSRGVRVSVGEYVDDWQQVAAEIGGARLVVASRLHALIFAARLRVPMVVVGRHSAKLTAFARDARVGLVSDTSGSLVGAARCADDAYVNQQEQSLRRTVDEVTALCQK